MHIYKALIFLLITLVIFSCKTAKTVTSDTSNLNLTAVQLLKENAKVAPVFNTLQSRLKISVLQNGKAQSYSVNFRAKKDEVLWISATFSVVKALVTPEKVSFYNKLDGTYFEGDYNYLSNLLGTELDFIKLQNLLFGEALFPLDATSYKVATNTTSYILQPKKQPELFDLLFLLDPVQFKLKSQQVSQPKAARHLQIDYLTFQEVEKQLIPEQLKVKAVEKNKETVIDLEFNAVTLNEALTFPYSIPSGFKEIKF